MYLNHLLLLSSIISLSVSSLSMRFFRNILEQFRLKIAYWGTPVSLDKKKSLYLKQIATEANQAPLWRSDLKNIVYDYSDTSMAAILDFQNGLQQLPVSWSSKLFVYWLRLMTFKRDVTTVWWAGMDSLIVTEVLNLICFTSKIPVFFFRTFICY